ncbi:3'-5' exonuclease [Pseudomonas aeruginosa]|uniref:3'-5' exonuclease n=1 Tax=Pseudomonas aeruginosa TaxID=287 RepID=UPI000FFB7D17|nr:3'-5' exonuclease [Pseudomonas aeruginosa]RMK89513.1 DNA polymerase III subunit epsilon [Pseudomonas aeruginosa]
MMSDELYVSVDVETSGPVPGIYSLLSIGACVVSEPAQSIYLELQPDGLQHDPEAVAVTGLDLAKLKNEGLAPQTAMQQVCSADQKVVFVGLNAPFDWSFINYYFHKYSGANPFGFTALDMKAYYMGVTGCRWKETKSSQMTARFNPQSAPNHNALDDARFQGELFALMLAEARNR